MIVQNNNEKMNWRFIVLDKVMRPRMGKVPFQRKTQDLAADIKDMWVGKRPALLDQLHRLKRTMALRHKNAGAHRYATVTSTRAMSIDLATAANRFECRPRAALQLVDRNGEERTVYCSQRQKAERLNVCI